jgi:hypothetical protein
MASLYSGGDGYTFPTSLGTATKKTATKKTATKKTPASSDTATKESTASSVISPFDCRPWR